MRCLSWKMLLSPPLWKGVGFPEVGSFFSVGGIIIQPYSRQTAESPLPHHQFLARSANGQMTHCRQTVSLCGL